ncbi:hypothetical protein F4808DRAFT_353816 [Astrocystis sublimbata]|nr:hypothetical protein F4808DRAFT_353816 [Astrocystis sublimbata]
MVKGGCSSFVGQLLFCSAFVVVSRNCITPFDAAWCSRCDLMMMPNRCVYPPTVCRPWLISQRCYIHPLHWNHARRVSTKTRLSRGDPCPVRHRATRRRDMQSTWDVESHGSGTRTA